jgi:hypothetical protein
MNPHIQQILHDITVRITKLEEAQQPQRTWVGLTDEEKIKLWDRAEKRQAYQSVPAFIALIQEVESKLKEKNL